MKGRIKAGEGTLIGNAGEYYVVAELLKRGVIAALAPRNSPAFDILATKEEKTIRIRVKTKSEGFDDWQWMCKKDGKVFRHISRIGDFTVLVNLTKETKDLTFYIVSTFILDNWLSEDFSKWVATPGKNGRPHDANNAKRNLSLPKCLSRLDQYQNNWGILWTVEDG